MATYVPPKRATAWIGYISLSSAAIAANLQANPTLAAGDVKVSIDGGAFANLTTLPAVTPAAGIAVKVSLSAAEMTGDNIFVVFVDQTATKEWCDYSFTLQTAARQIDDLAWPTTSGRSLDVTATGAAGIDWANVENPTTALALTTTTISTSQIVASVTGAVGGSVAGNVTGSVGSVTGSVGGNVTGSVGSLAAQAKADVNDQVLSVLNVTTFAEPGQGAPAATTTLAAKIGYIYKFLRNKITQTATTFSVYDDSGAVVDQRATVSDDSTTFTRSEIESGP